MAYVIGMLRAFAKRAKLNPKFFVVEECFAKNSGLKVPESGCSKRICALRLRQVAGEPCKRFLYVFSMSLGVVT